MDERSSPGVLWRSLTALASLKLTLTTLPLLAIGVLFAYQDAASATWWLVAPLTLCAANLAAAVITNRVFRRQLPLLLFHLALLALVVLVAAGRLTYFKARAELVDGEAFTGDLAEVDAGPWHLNRLDRVRFVNEGFSVDYAPGLHRGATRNTLRVLSESGPGRQVVIGDNQPLTVAGYRFYTSFNKGFAPIFRWYPPGAKDPVVGAVHLPPYPANEHGQALEWTIPGTATRLWIMLQFDGPLIDATRADQFKLPSLHSIVVRSGERRWELRPGESVEIAGGRLEYDHLRAWMGYNIFYDWTLPWLLAACFAAVASLAAHFWTKFAARPWNTAPHE
jgi:cytochrome c biogenesis protein